MNVFGLFKDLGAWGGVLLFCLFWQMPVLAGEFRVGTWKTAQTIQPFFYEDFVSPGAKVGVFSFTNPADQKTALLAGSLDMCGTTLAHAIHSGAQGQPVVVVAALCNKCSALVVRRDGPVREIKDLKDRKIGYVPGTMHEILLREALFKNGLSPDEDVRLVRVDFFDMGVALGRGDIDAFLSGEPLPTLAVSQGYGRILAYPYYGDTIGTINAGMLVTRESVETRAEQVEQLVEAHARATRFLQKDRETWLERAAGFGVPLEVLRKAARNIELSWNMDALFVRRAKALGERMEHLGLIDRQPDYRSLFDLRFVERAARSLR